MLRLGSKSASHLMALYSETKELGKFSSAKFEDHMFVCLIFNLLFLLWELVIRRPTKKCQGIRQFNPLPPNFGSLIVIFYFIVMVSIAFGTVHIGSFNPSCNIQQNAGPLLIFFCILYEKKQTREFFIKENWINMEKDPTCAAFDMEQ